MKKTANKRVRGFTLIELIVVIAIVGVLAAILVPAMLGYVAKSRAAQYNANAKNTYTHLCSVFSTYPGAAPGKYTNGSVADNTIVTVGTLIIDLAEFNENFKGYFAFEINSNAAVMYTLWSNNEIQTANVAPMSLKDVTDSIKGKTAYPPTGCNPIT